MFLAILFFYLPENWYENKKVHFSVATFSKSWFSLKNVCWSCLSRSKICLWQSIKYNRRRCSSFQPLWDSQRQLSSFCLYWWCFCRCSTTLTDLYTHSANAFSTSENRNDFTPIKLNFSLVHVITKTSEVLNPPQKIRSALRKQHTFRNHLSNPFSFSHELNPILQHVLC